MRRVGHRFLPDRPRAGPAPRGQIMSGKSIITTTAIQIIEVETEADHPLSAQFGYDPADPLAVTMVIETDAGPVPWTFARELILDGRFEPAGDADVHVWPCLDTQGAAVVIVELESRDGAILLQFPARAVQEFVSASLAAVPEGDEQYDVDAWIEQLLANGDVATN
jgi:hypothetical protein